MLIARDNMAPLIFLTPTLVRPNFTAPGPLTTRRSYAMFWICNCRSNGWNRSEWECGGFLCEREGRAVLVISVAVVFSCGRVLRLFHAAIVGADAPLERPVISEKVPRNQMHECRKPLGSFRYQQDLFGSDV